MERRSTRSAPRDLLRGLAGDPRRRPAPPPRPRGRPDRPDHRGHRPRGRGRRGVHDRDRPRPPVRARRGRRLPRRPHAADGARRGRGHRPGRARDRHRPAASGRRVRRAARAARSTASAVRWTARARSRDRCGVPAEAAPPDPLSRPRIDERVSLGVRALDALVPCGRGQRLGIFAGSGVGKSSLLGMIARVDLEPRST